MSATPWYFEHISSLSVSTSQQHSAILFEKSCDRIGDQQVPLLFGLSTKITGYTAWPGRHDRMVNWSILTVRFEDKIKLSCLSFGGSWLRIKTINMSELVNLYGLAFIMLVKNSVEGISWTSSSFYNKRMKWLRVTLMYGQRKRWSITLITQYYPVPNAEELARRHLSPEREIN